MRSLGLRVGALTFYGVRSQQDGLGRQFRSEASLFFMTGFVATTAKSSAARSTSEVKSSRCVKDTKTINGDLIISGSVFPNQPMEVGNGKYRVNTIRYAGYTTFNLTGVLSVSIPLTSVFTTSLTSSIRLTALFGKPLDTLP